MSSNHTRAKVGPACSRLVVAILGLVLSYSASVASACPFCSALQPTLRDKLDQSQSVVIACWESATQNNDGFYTLRLRRIEVLKGEAGANERVVEVTAEEAFDKDSRFLLLGGGEPTIWDSPMEISPDGVLYIRRLLTLSQDEPRRLEFFLRCLQHSDAFISDDAYNEFAEATLAEIATLKGKLDYRWVIAQLRDATLPVHRRRLCWTFLSQCGHPRDINLFDELRLAHQADPDFEIGLDAAISCLVALGGERALERIERDYLLDPSATYSETFAAVSAIRVHAMDLDVIPRERCAKALRVLLDRPEMADLVIADLARLEDWSAVDQMVELFQSAPKENRLVKPATVLYLKTCPLPSATKALERLRTIDARAVQFAEMSMRMYPGIPSVPVPPPE